VTSGRFRLVSLNLCSGRSLSDGVIDARRLRDAVAGLDADVLALQEVDRAQPRSGLVDQARLVREAAMPDVVACPSGDHLRYVATVYGVPGGRWRRAPDDDGQSPPDGPSYGIALMCRPRVAAWHVLRLDPPPGRYPIPVRPRPPWLLWLRDEPRAVVAAVLERPRLTVASAHLSFVPGYNAAQLGRVRRWLARLPPPVVLLGDLNLTERIATRITRWTPLVSAPTFPAPRPRWQLDHALAAALPPGVRTTGRTVELPVSDHRAIVIDLESPHPYR
jgi:endonuclease/exonuclease/phosphatase family metal-dependent hydrolase